MCGLLTLTVCAADGDLDASFDGDGKVTTGNFFEEGGRDVVIQPDGKIICVGGKTSSFNIQNFAAVRYNTDGSLDSTFGAGGIYVLPSLVGSQFVFGKAVAVDLQPDGKILLAGTGGTSGSTNQIYLIIRLNANGTLDTTFGSGGRVIYDLGNNNQYGGLSSMLFDAARSKIYIGATRAIDINTGIYGYSVTRFNADGSLDTTFNGTGAQTFQIGDSRGGSTILADIALQPDGKIVATGGIQYLIPNTPSIESFGTARINVDGTLDSTFGTNGIVITDFSYVLSGTSTTLYYSAIGSTVSLLSNGKIFLGGIGGSGSGGTTQNFYFAAQLNSDGSPDSSFGTSGRIRAEALRINDSIIQPNGKIIVVGDKFTDFAVGRLNANGTIDTTFGAGGVVQTDFGFTDSPFSVALQTDGKIVAAGGAKNPNTSSAGMDYNLVARYNGTAAPVSNPTLRFADFDGDGKTDVSVFRQGNWFINPSGSPSFAPDSPNAFYGVRFGQTGDITVPADYDGDGKSDIAVWRGGASAYFYILNSSNNTVRSEQFGTTGDNPTVSGDWDADGKADLAVYRGGAQSYFYYRPSAQTGVNFITLQWGTSGDTPIFGDFDGDRKLDATVYRPVNNTFYVRQSSNGVLMAKQWGNAQTDAIFAGDFDGDGKSDFAVQRFSGAEAGIWFVAQSGGANRAFRWGTGSDLPVPADYDGDGKTDFAVFRRSNGTWYIYQSASNTPAYSVFGANTDFPLPLNLVR